MFSKGIKVIAPNVPGSYSDDEGSSVSVSQSVQDSPKDFSPTENQEGLVCENLFSEDHNRVLDAIDKLKGYNLEEYNIDLPEIIVCGDQSSGKSSVLEAISRMAFPRASGICTVFPTELILRRENKTSFSVSIIPHESRSEKEKKEIEAWNDSGKADDIVDKFEAIVRSAEDFLRLQSEAPKGSKSFFQDTLRVEISDPSFVPLKLTDLPGIIHTPNTGQVDKDVERSHELVRKYIENKESIILAVVSASNVLANQQVLTLARDVDPDGARTLCVVTKPDIADQGQIADLLKYIESKDYMDWHVVKNRDFDNLSQSLLERDQTEDSYFKKTSVWAENFKPDQRGINSLRNKLSTLFNRRCAPKLHEITYRVKKEIKDREDQLHSYGELRDTPSLQKDYVMSLSSRFREIIRSSVDGNYSSDDFFRASANRSVSRLRTRVRFESTLFGKRMNGYGHTAYIKDLQPEAQLLDTKPFEDKVLHELQPVPVTQKEFLERIQEKMDESRGLEMPETFNPLLIEDIFRMQSTHWEFIASFYMDSCWKHAVNHVKLIIKYLVGDSTDSSIALQHHLDEDMAIISTRLVQKLRELLKPYKSGHAMTYDPAFQRQYLQPFVIQPGQGIGEDVNQVSNKQERSPCIDILEVTLAYYKIALRTFIDNIAILAVENCLMDALRNELFTDESVRKWTEEQINLVGGESKMTIASRNQLQKHLKNLKKAEEVCYQSYVRFRQGYHEPAARLESSFDARLRLPTPTKTPSIIKEGSRPASRDSGIHLGSEMKDKK